MNRATILTQIKVLSRKPLSSCTRLFGTEVFRPTLQQVHQQLVQSGTLKEDKNQTKLLKLMEKLRNHLEKYNFEELETQITPKVTNDTPVLSKDIPSGVAPQQGNSTTEHSKTSPEEISAPPTPSIQRLRGIYIHGPVGTGKTMVMDVFYKHCDISAKRRVHFHEFMLEVHRRIHLHKQQLLQEYGQERHIHLSSSRDSIKAIALEISREAKLLCFDEFQVTDICDALIMTRLFNELWTHGTVLIATSNRPPEELYLNGLNRHDFLPFIKRLQQECLVRNLDSQKDYRVCESTALHDTYFVPNSPENRDHLMALYQQNVRDLLSSSLSLLHSTGLHTPLRHPTTHQILIPISGNRFFPLEQAHPELGICLIDFQALCQQDRGASDYRALVTHFHTIYVTNIPQMSTTAHNAARRFITFIDEAYNSTTKLVWMAATPPTQLFLVQQLLTDTDTDANSGLQMLDGEEVQGMHAEEDRITPHVLNNTNNNNKKKEYSRNYQPGNMNMTMTMMIAISLL